MTLETTREQPIDPKTFDSAPSMGVPEAGSKHSSATEEDWIEVRPSTIDCIGRDSPAVFVSSKPGLFDDSFQRDSSVNSQMRKKKNRRTDRCSVLGFASHKQRP